MVALLVNTNGSIVDALVRLVAIPQIAAIWGRRPGPADVRNAQLRLKAFLWATEQRSVSSIPVVSYFFLFGMQQHGTDATNLPRCERDMNAFTELHLVCCGGAPTLVAMRRFLEPYRNPPKPAAPRALPILLPPLPSPLCCEMQGDARARIFSVGFDGHSSFVALETLQELEPLQ